MHYPNREVCSIYNHVGETTAKGLYILKLLYFPAGLRNNVLLSYSNDKQEMHGGQRMLQSRPMPIKGLQQQKRAAKPNVCTLPR